MPQFKASLALAIWLAVVATIAANSTTTRAAVAPSLDQFGAPQPAAESKGAQIYAQHCASCHDNGVAKAPHPRMLGFLSTAGIYRALSSGVMRSQAANLSVAQRRSVAEYLTQSPLEDTQQANSAPRCTGAAATFDWSQPISGANWGLSWGNERMVSNEQAGLSKADIGKLRLKWAFEFPGARRTRSHPLLAATAVFVGSESGALYALDQGTGCIRWTFQAPAEVRTGITLSVQKTKTGTRRLLLFGDLLGRVYAINAQTGQEVWRLRADDHPGATITGTPTAHNGVVYVPVSSLEVVSASSDDYPCCNFRGSVLALDVATGNEIWRTYTVAEVPRAQQKNSAGSQNYGPSGAPIWNSPAIDEARGLLYVGTGENYSSPATNTSDSILALNLRDGKIRWVYQATANDVWNTACSGRTRRANCPKEDGPDFDFGAAAVLTRTAQGKDIVLGGQKSGEVHAINPDDGSLIWRTRLGRGGLHGGVHFGIAVSEQRVYVPISDANDYGQHAQPARPGLYALNVNDGTEIWSATLENACAGREFCDVGIGAAITATPSLVFAGALDGYLRIYDANSGQVIRAIDTTKPVKTISGTTASGGSMDGGTAPLPFHGQLYVNSGYNFAGHMPGNVLLVYAVGED